LDTPSSGLADDAGVLGAGASVSPKPRTWWATAPRISFALFVPAAGATATLIDRGISTTTLGVPGMLLERRLVSDARTLCVSVCAGSSCRIILQTAIAFSSRPSAA